MDEPQLDALTRCRAHFVKNMSNVDMIVNSLVSYNILTEMMAEDITDNKSLTRQNKAQKLMELLPRRQNGTFEKFWAALKENGQQHLADKLVEELKKKHPNYDLDLPKLATKSPEWSGDQLGSVGGGQQTRLKEKFNHMLSSLADSFDSKSLEQLKFLFHKNIQQRGSIKDCVDLFRRLQKASILGVDNIGSLWEALSLMDEIQLQDQIKEFYKKNNIALPIQPSNISNFRKKAYSIISALETEEIKRIVFRFGISEKDAEKIDQNRWDLVYTLLKMKRLDEHDVNSLSILQETSSSGAQSQPVHEYQDQPTTRNIVAASTLPHHLIQTETMHTASNLDDATRELSHLELNTEGKSFQEPSSPESCFNHNVDLKGERTIPVRSSLSLTEANLESDISENWSSHWIRLQIMVIKDENAVTLRGLKTILDLEEKFKKEMSMKLEYIEDDSIIYLIPFVDKNIKDFSAAVVNGGLAKFVGSAILDQVDVIGENADSVSVYVSMVNRPSQSSSESSYLSVYASETENQPGNLISEINDLSLDANFLRDRHSTHPTTGQKDPGASGDTDAEHSTHGLEQFTISGIGDSPGGVARPGHPQTQHQPLTETGQMIQSSAGEQENSITDTDSKSTLDSIQASIQLGAVSAQRHSRTTRLSNLTPVDQTPGQMPFIESSDVGPYPPSSESINPKERQNVGFQKDLDHGEKSSSLPCGSKAAENISAKEMNYEEIAPYFDEKLEPLGEGGAGKIYKGTKMFKNQHVVVKVMYKCTQEKQHRKAYSSYLAEMICSRKKHPFLLPLLAYCEKRKKSSSLTAQYLLMYPYMENLDLEQYLVKVRKGKVVLPWEDRVRIVYQIAEGLEYLHSKKGKNQKIVHRDVKAANILLDGELNARLSDPGLAKEVPDLLTCVGITYEGVGTPGYKDPCLEWIREYHPINDVFGLGVVMLQLLFDKPACGNSKSGKAVFFLYDTWKKKELASSWTKSGQGKEAAQAFQELAEHAVKYLERNQFEDIEEEEVGEEKESEEEQLTGEEGACKMDETDESISIYLKKIRIELNELCSKLKDLMNKYEIEKWKPPQGGFCCACMNNPIAKLKTLSSFCDDQCQSFCTDCLKDNENNPLHCPHHGPCLPPVGHENTVALLVSAGFGTEDELKIFKADVNIMKSILLDKHVIGVREANIHVVHGSKQNTVKDIIKEKVIAIQKEMSSQQGDHLFFLFFYSGHYSVKEGGNFLLGSKKVLDYLSDNEVKTMLRDINAKNMLFILDCCYSDSVFLVEKDGESDSVPTEVENGPQLWDIFDNFLKEKGDQMNLPTERKAAQWSSSASNEKSYFIVGEPNSVFTKSIATSLDAELGCICQDSDKCTSYDAFKKMTAEKNCIPLPDIHKFVKHHVESELLKKGKGDNLQVPQLKPALFHDDFPPFAFGQRKK